MAFETPFDKENSISGTDFTTEDDRTENENFSLDDTGDIESTDGEIFEIFEDYSCPDLESLQDEDVISSETIDNSQHLWILLWIMSFRTRFNLSETVTEALIKFMKLVLREVGGAGFDTFPDSLYLTRKAIGLKDRFRSFVPCSKCHKLYKKQEVKDFCQDGTLAVMKCRHVEYPNSITRKTQICQMALSRQTKLLSEQISNIPILIYPFAGIQQQLKSMYRQPEFEASLRY